MFKGIRRLSEMTKIIRFSADAANATIPMIDMLFEQESNEVKQPLLSIYVAFLAIRQKWKHHTDSEINYETVHHIYRAEHYLTPMDRERLIVYSFTILVNCLEPLHALADEATVNYNSGNESISADCIATMLSVIYNEMKK